MTNPVEELASKGMGAMKAGKATLEGLTGIFKRLAIEHGEVSALLLRVKSSSDPKVRAELFPKIRKELLSHEKGEMTVLYPVYREYAELAQIAEKHDMEAGQLEQMIATVEQTEYQDAAWASHFDALVDLVKRHVAEEEDEFFPKGEKALGERTQSLELEFKQIKEAMLNSLQ
jgi:hemerythrin superfamily protein